MLGWGRDVFGLTINELYGQTEANLTVAELRLDRTAQGRSMGRAVPGHVVDIVAGRRRPAGKARGSRHYRRQNFQILCSSYVTGNQTGSQRETSSATTGY